MCVLSVVRVCNRCEYLGKISNSTSFPIQPLTYSMNAPKKRRSSIGRPTQIMDPDEGGGDMNDDVS